MSTLEYANVSVRYGHGAGAHLAVQDVDLTVRSGRVHGLVGESGSGKSTLAAAAVGLVRPAAGTIRLDGVDIVGSSASVRATRRRVQMIFQDPFSALDPRMPIGESIAEGMRATGRRPARAERTRRVKELLELVHIDPARAGEPPGAFSGGQCQRVTIARALAAEPDVVIADEITSALDVSVQGVVLNLLRELQAELKLTILFISHNLAVVRYMCDTVSVMRQGRIVESGATESVLSAPSHPYTRELLAAVPVMGERFDWEKAT
ncbi:peptide/nickel transport system ATP-binding protein [Thermocatellispora tengchongensis]|uniref:Peptide/nickel transport system ATP-binding protein n=1 Tax=Thermocatellispora tengchongensis TaxID=1073253 RepID=A0A840PHB4_9ACTN|nr:ATP-binding cassette domain-containing protein [Thermocatellispora tengchongensis]MBB5136920.1 peptide/nickel transport system ATP-binding protein [Thermocatellispora tengchongensis]